MKKYVPAPLILALLCLALPFTSVSCDGMKMNGSTITGFQLLTGYSDLLYDVPANLFIMLFAISVAVGIFFSLSGSKGSTMLAAICASVGLGALLIFSFEASMRIKSESTPFFEANIIYEYGLLLAGIALAAAIIFSMSGEESYTSASARSPASRLAPPVSRNVPPPRNAPQQSWSVPQAVNLPGTPGSVPGQVPGRYAPPSDTFASKPAESRGGMSASYYSGSPQLVGISGQFAGQSVELNQGQVTIGRDPRVAHLIYQHASEEISRKHCTVYYDEQKQKFVVEDVSTNGTYVYPQTRLNYGQPVYLEAGTRFFISNPSELFELRLA